jgi:hypothetical protein
MKRDIPYYAQTAEFSCGPACLLMVLNFFDPAFGMDRSREFEIWRQCNMIGIRGADPWGLSVPLLEAGYKVHLRTAHEKMVDPGPWKHRHTKHGFPLEDMELALFGIDENQKRALARGLCVSHGRPTVEGIEVSCREGDLPVALVHMGVVHQYDIPHWVVVAGVESERVIFNDPYPPQGGKDVSVSHADFQRMLDDIGTRIGLSPSVLFIRKGNP